MYLVLPKLRERWEPCDFVELSLKQKELKQMKVDDGLFPKEFMIVHWALIGVFAIIGLLYAGLNRDPWGKCFRGLSSGYIVLIYLALGLFLTFKDRLNL